MGAFLIGLLLLTLVAFALNAFANANPANLVVGVRRGGGIIALLFAGFLTLRGMWAFAIPVGVFGLSLLGLRMPYSSGFGARMHRSPGQTSTVRGAWVEMTLHHDTGAMDGRILKGDLGGQMLDDIDIADLIDLFGEVDADSAALLEAYLDRRAPGWRSDDETDMGGGQGESAPVQGPMTQEEAYEVLGLSPGASDTDIRAAHRALMKRLHPDRGGSTYIAAKINEAKDTLLNTHR